MRFLVSLLIASLSLSLTSAQLPASSRQAWDDSFSLTPKNKYGQINRTPFRNGTRYDVPTSALTQWNDPAYYTKNYLTAPPTFDSAQYRFPDATYNITLADGFPRAYHVWYPKNFKKDDPSNKNKYDVWYALHGFSEAAFYPYYDGQQQWSGFPIYTNLTGFTYHNNYILVAPEGLENNPYRILAGSGFDTATETAWNAGNGKCCSTRGADDVTFITTVRNNIDTLYKPKKHIIAGFSNGAMMTNRLACEKRDLFDAFIAVAGGVNINGDNSTQVLADCDQRYATLKNVKAKPILLIHGKNDNVVPYQGNNPYIAANSAPVDAAAWAKRNGCPSTPQSATNLYTSDAGLTTFFFNTATNPNNGVPVVEYPQGLTATTFVGKPEYFGYNRLPLTPSTQVYTDKSCAAVELISHYDTHTWLKKQTSVADDIIYQGNGVFELNEYIHNWVQRTTPGGLGGPQTVLYATFDIKWSAPSNANTEAVRSRITNRMKSIATDSNIRSQLVVNPTDIKFVSGYTTQTWRVQVGFTDNEIFARAQAKNRFIAQLRVDGLSAVNIQSVGDHDQYDVTVDVTPDTEQVQALTTCTDGTLTSDATCPIETTDSGRVSSSSTVSTSIGVVMGGMITSLMAQLL